MTIKLSKGTLVALVNNDGMAAEKGAVAKLTKNYNNEMFINVEWIDEKANKQQHGQYDLKDFIVIKDKSKTDILLLMNKMGYR